MERVCNKEDWYVIQVLSGSESLTKKLIETTVDPENLEECFIPLCQMKKCFKGTWKFVLRKLLPGYLIVVTNHAPALMEQLRKVPAFTKMLLAGQTLLPLTQEEKDWICAFTDNKERVVGFSTGYIVGDDVRITNGPLRYQEARIKKIDRHKRIAFVEVDMFGRPTIVKVGLEIVKKLAA